jgi:hypothetical protein
VVGPEGGSNVSLERAWGEQILWVGSHDVA